MKHCRFCQAELEPGTQKCQQCGQFQSASLTDITTQPGATTALLSSATRLQDESPDTPHSIVSMPDREPESSDAKVPEHLTKLVATPSSPVMPIGSQGKLETPTTGVIVPVRGSEMPQAQETASEGQLGAPLETTQILTWHCPTCQKLFPARALFCPACGHPAGHPGKQLNTKNNQKATVVEATVRQEEMLVATPSMQETSLHQQETILEQQPPAPAAVVASGPQKEEQKAEEEEEEEGPVATFRKRRIAFKTLSRPLQILLVLTLAQIGAVAILLATQNLPQPLVFSGYSLAGQDFVSPLATFIVLTASLIAGVWFAVAGAMRVHWSLRVAVVALATWVLAELPITRLSIILSLRIVEGPFVTEEWVRWIQLVLIACFWVWAVGISLRQWHAKRKGIPVQDEARAWHGWTFGITVIPILLYYSLEFVIWGTYVGAGLPQSGTRSLQNDIGAQALTLFGSFALLALWSSTDLQEWGEIMAKSVVATTRRVRTSWVLPVLTTLAALAMTINVLRQEGNGALSDMIVLAVLGAIIILLVRFAQIRSDWPAQIPPLALLLGAIFLFVVSFASSFIASVITSSQGLGVSTSIQKSFINLVMAPLDMVGLITGLLLLARGRMGKFNQGIVGLFLALVSLLFLTARLPDILDAAGFSVAFLHIHFTLGGMELLAAVGALLWIARLLTRRPPLSKVSQPMVSVFLLLAGLQIVGWVYDLTQGISALGAHSTLLLAGLFVLTILWDVLTSGEQVTNSSSAAFPREGRILLYLGYTLVATSLLAYYGSLRGQTTGDALPDYLSLDTFAALGLLILGPSMVVLTFLLRMRHNLPWTARVAVLQGAARRASPRSLQPGILGSGTLALVLVIIFLAVSAIPRLVHLGQQLSQVPYTAVRPGPGCDTGGALWSVQPDASISIHCLSTGTQITAIPKKFDFIGFTPPGNTPVQNYRVSVHIDFSNAPHTCVDILVHYIPNGSSYHSYQSGICPNGAWSLYAVSYPESATLLRYGRVAIATTYTLAVTTSGTEQSLALDGVTKASITDVPGAGDIELAVSNTGTSTESVVLSDFVYAPLPSGTRIVNTATPTPTAASWSSYVPSSAKLAFTDPLTGPDHWKNQPANAYGTTCQFVQGGYQVQVTTSSVTDDCGGVGGQAYTNFVFEVTMRIVTGACGGIDFRVTNTPSGNNPGYYFLVCQSSNFGLGLITLSGKQNFLIPATFSPAIHTGPNASNLIAIVANGPKLALYANGQSLLSMTDSTLSHGYIDVAATDVNSPTQVIYSDARVWTL